MLEVKDLSIMLGERYLIKDLSFNLNVKDKMAIIGEEGNGKSTLLKSILSLCDYAKRSGTIDTHNNRIGYLEQTMSEENLNKKVSAYLFTDEEDYYNKINDFYKYLEVIKLDDSILEASISMLSGGEKIKIGILKLLLEDYDIYFLDEPTNDLDIESLLWLENFINTTNKPIIYISHDEELLSHTANMILHIEQINKKSMSRINLLKTDYDTYIKKRLEGIHRKTQISKNEKREFVKKQEKLQKVMNKVEYQQNIISRSDPHGAKLLKKKMHAIKAQERKMNHLELTEIPDVEEEINFFFDDITLPKNKEILNLDLKELKVGNKTLSSPLLLTVRGNTHLAIVGKNGVGKSTLIKKIYEDLRERKDIRVGYMPQNYDDILNNYDTVLDFLCSSKDKEDITRARTYLGNMKFTKEEMAGKIKNLSNGSKAKLLLVKLVIDHSNVLVLDEPTRNVSPLSSPVIRKILKEFNGPIISVSHDRKYLKEVVDDIYILSRNGLCKKSCDEEYTL